MEDLVDAANRFERQRRLCCVGEHDEVAPAMAPARRFRDGRGSALCLHTGRRTRQRRRPAGCRHSRQMPGRVFTVAIARVEEQGAAMRKADREDWRGPLERLEKVKAGGSGGSLV